MTICGIHYLASQAQVWEVSPGELPLGEAKANHLECVTYTPPMF